MNKDEIAKQSLIDQLNEILELAREAFNKPKFVFHNGSYYGQIWNEIMTYLTTTKPVHESQNLPRKLFKAFIVFIAVRDMRGTLAYFDQDNKDAWHEKIRFLLNTKTEDEYDSACYEFYVGANLSMDKKDIFFCNMEGQGQGSQSSRCEYFISPRLFVECKNLFGVGKSSIDKNIRTANSQIRETMKQIVVSNAIGVVCLDLPEKVDIDNRNETVDKLKEAINRLKQCDSTHFLYFTYMNVINNAEGSESVAEFKLIINPNHIELLQQDPTCLLLFQPRFRYVYIPQTGKDVFDRFDMTNRQTIQNIPFEDLFK
jgi:hypothetical protein